MGAMLNGLRGPTAEVRSRNCSTALTMRPGSSSTCAIGESGLGGTGVVTWTAADARAPASAGAAISAAASAVGSGETGCGVGSAMATAPAPAMATALSAAARAVRTERSTRRVVSGWPRSNLGPAPARLGSVFGCRAAVRG